MRICVDKDIDKLDKLKTITCSQVLALAVNYMDRMLCRFQIHKNQFQLLASTCVFLASKFRENEPVTAEKLVVMTDFSISVDLILVGILSTKSPFQTLTFENLI